jgi:DNA modification methylase
LVKKECIPKQPERRRRLKATRRAVSSLVRNLTIENVLIERLKPSPLNARTHSPRQIDQIANSIRKLSFTNPILVDNAFNVIVGHGRLMAAVQLRMKRVPVIRIAHLSDAQKRALQLADNKIAENAGWDLVLLAQELQYLSTLDLDFDLTLTGFDVPEIDLLIQNADIGGSKDGGDEIPPIEQSVPTTARIGDLWILGEHRLLCADATRLLSFRNLLGREKAQMVITDPPYNVSIDGNVCGLGSIKHREFLMAAGEMTDPQFLGFLTTVASNLVRFSVDGSIHFIFMDWRHLGRLLSATHGLYSEFKNLCVWNKDNGGMGSLYRSKHELVPVFKKGTAPHINNIELGRHGRNRTNVWDYPGVNSLHAGRLDELAMHPTVKPVALVADAILDCSTRRGIILDCFGGSATMVIAAEKTGRRAYVMELDPLYVDVAIMRFEKFTGQDAVHNETGLSFADMQHQRGDEMASIKETEIE